MGGERVAFRTYGPHAGWVATSYQKLSDGTARLLWTHEGDGRSSLLRLDANGDRVGLRVHGSQPGWSGQSVHR